MKSTTLWVDPHSEASNSSGFTGIAGGSMAEDGSSIDVGESGGAYGVWWSAKEYAVNLAWSRSLYNFSSDVWREGFDKNYGFSVRCVKD